MSSPLPKLNPFTVARNMIKTKVNTGPQGRTAPPPKPMTNMSRGGKYARRNRKHSHKHTRKHSTHVVIVSNSSPNSSPNHNTKPNFFLFALILQGFHRTIKILLNAIFVFLIGFYLVAFVFCDCF